MEFKIFGFSSSDKLDMIKRIKSMTFLDELTYTFDGHDYNTIIKVECGSLNKGFESANNISLNPQVGNIKTTRGYLNA